MTTTLDVADYAGRQIAALRDEGFVCEMVYDFDRVNSLCETMGKPYNTRIIDPLFNDFTKDNCFWFVVKKDGRYVACAGVRRDNIENGSFTKFLDAQFARVYFNKPNGAIKEKMMPPVFSEIGGQVIYFGDLFVVREFQGRRRGFNLQKMVSILECLAYLTWSFDWFYSFIRDEHVVRGYSSIYRAARQYPSAIMWVKEPEMRKSTEWFTASKRADFEYMVSVDCLRLLRDDL